MTRFIWKLFTPLAVIIFTLAACGGQPAQEAPAAPVQIEAGAELDLPVNIGVQTVEEIRNRDDVILIDVREDWEYADGHIPGATLIPLGQIPDRLAEIPKDKTVVAVCRSGNRSGQATDFLQQQGFDNIHNMQGGMNAWSQTGFDIEQ